MDDRGLESVGDAQAKNKSDPELYAHLYAQDADLVRIAELWPDLARRDKQAIVRLAEQFALQDPEKRFTKETN